MKIIVTGGTGFIGKRVIPLLTKKYKTDQLLFLIRNKNNALETKGRRILKSYGLKTKLVDFESGKGLDNLPKNPEVIIHMAANTNTGDPNHNVNDKGTENLIKALSTLSGKTHIIYTSTTAIMSGRKNCSRPFDESSKPYPTNKYGRTKLKAEVYLQKMCKHYGYPLTVLRLPTVWGKNMRKDSFFNFIKKYIDNNSFITRINWPGLTSFVHVDDVAKTIVELIKHPPNKGKHQVFILQSDSYTLREIFQYSYSYYNRKFKPINLPGQFWNITKYLRKYVYTLLNILPNSIYNYFWRLSIVVDNVIYTKSNKIKKVLPTWKTKKLTQNLDQVL